MQKQIALALFATTTVYALTLRHIPYEPNWTWATVVIGTALCLGAAACDVRLRAREGRGATWRSYEIAVWAAFVWGGVPIIVWQVTEAVARGL